MHIRKLAFTFILLVLVVIPLANVSSTTENTTGRSTTTFAALDLGYIHACAITTDGDLMCWGDNTDWYDYGALGVGEYPYNSPIPLFSLFDETVTSVSKVSAGDGRTCAITSAGTAYCWGEGSYGELGNGLDDYSHTPVLVSGTINWAEISTGTYVSCGISTTGAAYCWGDNFYGELGHVEDPAIASSNVPVTVDTLGSNVRSISTGYAHACAVTTNNDLYCWGYNNRGQIGNGNTDNVFAPALILSDVADVSVGGSHTCALMTNEGIMCWGINSDCQLGDGTADPENCTGYQTSPSYVTNLGSGSGVTVIDGDFDHTCALMSDLSIKCWGWNYSGQLGDGTTNDSAIPVTVNFGSDTREVTAFSTGEYHTCALMNDNNIRCWGDNDSGELGTGDYESRILPTADVLTGRGHIYARFYNSSSQTTGFVASAAYSSTDLESTPVIVNTGYSNGYINELFPPAGTYYILGFVDVNGNGAYDKGEAYAWYDDDDSDQEPNSVTISEGEYLELSPMIYINDPIAGSIQGTVICDSTHTVFVDLYVGDANPPPEESTHIACNESYNFSNLPDGTYYVGAWIDLNESGGGPPDDGEPYAWYGAPTAVTIIDGETKTDIDITFEGAGYAIFLPLIIH
ncbi:MAG: hypothetical protein RQ728_08965 [Brevefilum sp.]|nr:hypothetical protein [Brevefilum sp.]MDT8382368.1 hypothetical protein [Brevefilum sp.]